MSTPALVWHQFRFDEKRFWRDPAGLFYALGYPLIFLLVFVVVLGSNDESGIVAGRTLASANYYLPAVLTMAVVSVTFVNLAVSLTGARERGTLKRVRGTPLPTWVFMAGRITTAIVTTVVLVVLVVAVGRLAFGVAIPDNALPGAILALVVGTAAFCCLAFAFTIVVRSTGAAAAVAFTATLVLFFMSGLFARNDNIPDVVQTIAGVFPIKRLFEALAIAFDPATTGAGMDWTALGIMAGWGLAALAVSIRWFRWTPAAG